MILNFFHLILSIGCFYSIAFFLTTNKTLLSIKEILKGIIIHIIFAGVIIKIPAITTSFSFISKILSSLSESSLKGTSFLFGKLGNDKSDLGFILALHGMPVIIVISAITSLLMYWKVLPFFIQTLSKLIRAIFKIGGILGIGIATNIFAGLAETPLIIRSYLKYLTHSEIFSLMVCGTAGISTSVMVIYSIILQPVLRDPIIYVISSALISIPGALTIARIIVPKEKKKNNISAKRIKPSRARSAIDALYDGIIEGGKVMIKAMVMLIAFVALIDVVNNLLAYFTPDGISALTIQKILGWIMFPLVWIIGIPLNEAAQIGGLLGTKLVLNEVIAFTELVKISQHISLKTKIVTIYLLCSFANICCLGVMSSVYTTLAPERKEEVLDLAPRAVIAGGLVSCLNAAITNFWY